jgi:branched-chain amino acid transport system substrate-binding protein
MEGKEMIRQPVLFMLMGISLLFFVACQETTLSPTATPLLTHTPSSTDTPSPTDTPLPSATPVPTETPLPTDTPIPTDTPTPTNTPTATSTPPPTAVPIPVISGEFVCEDAIGCLSIPPGEPIHIAWIQVVSGPPAFLGEINVRGIEIAIADRGNQLLGRPIELTGLDGLCSIEGGEEAGAAIAADPTIVGVIGTTCSSEARGAMPFISDAGLVMISPSNTNPDMTDPDHQDHWPGYLRTAHNDLLQGQIAAEFAYNVLGLRSAATVHDGSPYSDELQQTFAATFSALGGTVTAQKLVEVGEMNLRPLLSDIAAAAPELIYFPIFEPEGRYLARQKCEVAGLENTVLMSADGLMVPDVPNLAGDCAIGMYLTAPYVSGEAYESFADRYTATYHEQPLPDLFFQAHAYDATNLLFAAMEWVVVMTADGTLHLGRQALRDALYTTQDFQGLTGLLSCDENGDCATGEALAILEITSAEVNGIRWPPKAVWQPGR